MSTHNITIFKKPTDVSLTSVDTKNILANLRDEEIPYYSFNAFSEFIKYDIPIKSNIPSLLIQSIFRHILPIITYDKKIFNIPTQSNTDIFAKLDNKIVIIPKNKQIYVTGIDFNFLYENSIKSTKFPRDNLSIESLIANGYYDDFEYKFQKRTRYKLTGTPSIYKFTDSADALAKIGIVYDSIETLNKYYKSVYTLLEPTKTELILPGIPSIYPVTKFNNLVEAIDKAYIYTISAYDPLLNIYNSNLWDIYSRGYVNGINGDFNDAINEYIEYQRLLIDNQVHNKKISDIRYVIMNKNIIARNLFGKPSLDLLTKKEIDIVEINYKTQNEISTTALKCPHSSLVRDIQNNKDIRKNWESLLDITNKTDDMFECKLCHTPSICVHYYSIYQSEGKNIRESLIKNYSHSLLNGSYFCKICGGVIAKDFDEAVAGFESRNNYGYIQTPLMSKIWKSTNQIINNIVFKTSVNIKQLVENISVTVHSYIGNIDIAGKSQSMDDNIIDAVTGLYIDVYIYATMIRLVSHYPNDITFKNNQSKKESKNKLGGDSSNINPKILQQSFNDALSLLLKSKEQVFQIIPHISKDAIKPMIVSAFKEIIGMAIQIDTDDTSAVYDLYESSMYRYLYFIKKYKNHKLNYTDVKGVIGVTIEESDNVKYPEIGIKDPYISLAASHFIDFLRTSKNSANSKLTDYDKEFRIEFLKYRYAPEYPNKYKNVNEKKYLSPLLNIYCLDGNTHSFNTYTYKKGLIQTTIMKSDFSKWKSDEKKSKELESMEFIDVSCSKCKIQRSKNVNISDELIQENIDLMKDKKSFYTYFNHRCPKGLLHIYKNDTCEKCGMKSKDDTKSYEIYKEVFNKMKEKKLVHYDKIPIEVIDMKEWTQDNKQFGELSTLTKIPKNDIMILGLLEDVDEDDINTVLAKANENAGNRLQHLRSYINMILIEYEMLKSGNINIPQLDKLVKKWQDVDFTKFPSIQYTDRTLYDINHKSSANYMLYTITNSLTLIHSYYKKESSEYKASLEFVTYILKKIIKSDRLQLKSKIVSGKLVSDEFDDDPDDIMDEVEHEEMFSYENTDMEFKEIQDNL